MKKCGFKSFPTESRLDLNELTRPLNERRGKVKFIQIKIIN